MCAIFCSSFFLIRSMAAAWAESSRRFAISIVILLLDKKIEHDPTLNIESPKQWKVLPKALARDEMEATLAAPLHAARVCSGASKRCRGAGHS